MAKKKALKGATKKVSLKGAVSKVASKLKGGAAKAVSTAKGGGFRRRHKKSAMWYAKEIARLKLKRRYEKIRLRV